MTDKDAPQMDSKPKSQADKMLAEFSKQLAGLREDQRREERKRDKFFERVEKDYDKIKEDVGEVKAVLLGGKVGGPRALTTAVEDNTKALRETTERVTALEKRDTTSKTGLIWTALAVAGASLISSGVGGAVVYFAAIAGK